MNQKMKKVKKRILMNVCISLFALIVSYKGLLGIQVQESESKKVECVSSRMIKMTTPLKNVVSDLCVNYLIPVTASRMEKALQRGLLLNYPHSGYMHFVCEMEDLYQLTSTELALGMECDAMELVAVIVQAEAGNQSLEGMRLVADVILNRIDSKKFPNTAEEVIFQEGQFGPVDDGGLERAAWNMSENAYKAVEMEWDRENRSNTGILYFNTSWDNGTNPFKFGDHWFSY